MTETPPIEFHPFGTVTFSFDDVAIKLRRCRLGDLQFAKDYLEELRTEREAERNAWASRLQELRDEAEGEEARPIEELQGELNDLVDRMTEDRVDMIHRWLSAIIARMGDNAPPPKDEWPMLFFDSRIFTALTEHWQTRPLASSKGWPLTTPNGAAEFEQQPPRVSSLPEQQQQ